MSIVNHARKVSKCVKLQRNILLQQWGEGKALPQEVRQGQTQVSNY